jgi:mono/diheme cytochrome c family protein
MTIRILFVLITAGLLNASVVAADSPKATIDKSKLPPVASKSGVTYVSDIKAIFDNACVKCHGSEKPKARLRLDSLEGALKGGSGGKAIKPGNSADSPLVHNVAHVGDPDYYMPPPGNKANIPRLTEEQVGLIRAWIDQGAK